MTTDGQTQQNTSGASFVAELYLPAAKPDARLEAISKVRQAAHSLREEGMPVRYLHSVHLPADETCFLFFEAGSSEAINTLAARAGLALNRITETITDH